jgi:hypothetical protein
MHPDAHRVPVDRQTLGDQGERCRQRERRDLRASYVPITSADAPSTLKVLANETHPHFFPGRDQNDHAQEHGCVPVDSEKARNP